MVNVIGLGYIGLPTALILAANDVEVIGTDYNNEVVSTLNSRKITFKEDGLEELINKATDSGIMFTTEYVRTDIYIVAVQTPYDKSSKKINPNFVIEAVKTINEICEDETIIIIESTVSPGTIDKYIRPIISSETQKNKKSIHLAHAPERIIPGNMIYELRHNARTIGVDSEKVGMRVKELYSTFCVNEITITDIRSAEMTKVVENTYRDINIAFANELAKICRSDNMNVYEIIRIANKHPRVNILQPGPGVGGHCISVDPWFLVGDYPGLSNLVLAARKINDSMPEYVLERIWEIMKLESITDISRVGFYGLTYKEDVDDLRESPALQIFESMERHLSQGYIKVYDPYITKDIFPNQYNNLEEFLNNIDLIVILISHSEIKYNIHKLANKVVLDTKKICYSSKTYYL